MEKYIKATDLAKTLGVHPKTIKAAYLKGQLAGKEITSVLLIAESSLDPYKEGKSAMAQRYEKRITELEKEVERLTAVMQKAAGALLQGGKA